MDCSWPESSVHGISQARILEWVAISFSRGPTCISWTSRQILYHWATWEAMKYHMPLITLKKSTWKRNLEISLLKDYSDRNWLWLATQFWLKFTERVVCMFNILLKNKPIFNMWEVSDKIAVNIPKNFKKQKQTSCLGPYGRLFHITLETWRGKLLSLTPTVLDLWFLKALSPELPNRRDLSEAILLEWVVKEFVL